VLKKVESRFDIKISKQNQKHLSLVPLSSYWVIEQKYPATLLLQSLSAAILALEGLFRATPHIFIDTTGFAFTYPVASLLFGCTVISYTHYPTISTDMLQRVEEGKVMYNNKQDFASNQYKKSVKLYYYKLFAILYGICGYFANITMVNSTWTYNHINSLFFRRTLLRGINPLKIVYPPCGNNEFLSKFNLEGRKKQILSVGQFRPEKNHKLQIEAFYEFRQKYKAKMKEARKAKGKDSSDEEDNVKLILVGGVRDKEDRLRVNQLRALITKFNLNEHVVIHVDMEWSKLLKLFGESFIGLHTMEDEHFGICLVEYMVAGLVTIGHCSGGPLSDIVANKKTKHDLKEKKIETDRGFLCTTKEQYAKCFETVFDQFEHGDGWLTLRQNARTYCVDKFSCTEFQHQFVSAIEGVF